MPSSRSLAAALAACLAAGTAVAAMGSPASAANPGPLTKAHLSVPAGSVLTAGDYGVDTANVTLAGDDTGFNVTMVSGAKTFKLTLTPNSTAATFPGGATADSQAGPTATAQHAAITLEETGGPTCTTTTGSIEIDDLVKTAAPAIDSVALHFRLTCQGNSGNSASGTVYVNQPAVPLGTVTPSEFVSMAPVRLLDTRLGSGTKVGKGASVDVDVTANTSNVPTDATAVVVNLTGVAPSEATFLTAYPKGSPPLGNFVSNLNLGKDDNVANLATVKVGADHAITVYNDQGSTDLVVDVVGYYRADDSIVNTDRDRFVPQAPERKYDSRTGTNTALAEGETRTIDLGLTADAVVVNLTVTEPTKGGFVTLFPANVATPPTASNINFVATQTIANLATVKLDAGKVKLYNPAGTTHVVLDVVGTYVPDATGTDTAGRFVPVTPFRMYDSRSGSPAPGALADRQTRKLDVLQPGGKYPFEYNAVVANLTATNTSNHGFLTAYPSNATERPFASNLNWRPGETRPNQIVAATDADGFTSFYNEGGTAQMIVDVAGYFTL